MNDIKALSSSTPGLDINDQFARAFHLMEHTDRSLFVTGKAGTGKSTLLRFFRENTKKSVAVLAPTGVAAVNIQGQTIHSFFNFKPDITPEKIKNMKLGKEGRKLYKSTSSIIIDEVSMVRADLMDCIDAFLRKYGRTKKMPFGGAQMIFIGDLYQLPPVVTAREKEVFSKHYKSPYFFDARVFDMFPMDFIELEKVYRQTDQDFIHLLNAIRNNSVTDDDIRTVNSRFIPDFVEKGQDLYIHLTTTNHLADALNSTKLSTIRGDSHTYEGRVKGEFSPRDLPTHQALVMKAGAQVMLLNNDTAGRWVNGSIGKVIDIVRFDDPDDPDVILVQLSDGRVVEVLPFTWEMFHFFYDDTLAAIHSQSVGSFSQYPLKLAWAVTIHKSQGKTFDRVIIDIGNGTFSHGQVYVALSRCTTLAGIVLKRPIQKHHIRMDWRIVRFITDYQYRISEKNCPLERKIEILSEAARLSRPLQIVYLKSKDDKSRRLIVPLKVSEMEYNGRTFWGVRAHCLTKDEERTFRVDRILEIEHGADAAE